MENIHQNSLMLGYLWGMLSTKGTFGSRGKSPFIQICNNDKYSLDLLLIFGGSVYGPFGKNSYRWIIAGHKLDELIQLLNTSLPSEEILIGKTKAKIHTVIGTSYLKWRDIWYKNSVDVRARSSIG